MNEAQPRLRPAQVPPSSAGGSKADCVSGTRIGDSRLRRIVLTDRGDSLKTSASLNGSESGGGLFPARFFASFRPAIRENLTEREQERIW
jgi:hypothetical protein